MHKTVVSTQMPYTIWSVGEDFQRLFHYSTTDILEQSLLKLTGPRTDLLLLCTSIESYGAPKKRVLVDRSFVLYSRTVVDRSFVLYSRTGENRKILVSFEPYTEGGNAYCLLGFKEADNDCANYSDINHANSMQQRCTFTIPETSSFKKSSERQSFWNRRSSSRPYCSSPFVASHFHTPQRQSVYPSTRSSAPVASWEFAAGHTRAVRISISSGRQAYSIRLSLRPRGPVKDQCPSMSVQMKEISRRYWEIAGLTKSQRRASVLPTDAERWRRSGTVFAQGPRLCRG